MALLVKDELLLNDIELLQYNLFNKLQYKSTEKDVCLLYCCAYVYYDLAHDMAPCCRDHSTMSRTHVTPNSRRYITPP